MKVGDLVIWMPRSGLVNGSDGGVGVITDLQQRGTAATVHWNNGVCEDCWAGLLVRLSKVQK